MSKIEAKPIAFSSKLINIQLDSFKVEVVDKELSAIDSAKFAFEFNLSFNFDQENPNRINILSNIKIFADQDKSLHLADMDSKGIFEVLDFPQILAEHEGNIPTVILAMFGGILISTTRGLLILKSKNTIVEGAMLPIVNVQEFFKPSNEQHK